MLQTFYYMVVTSRKRNAGLGNVGADFDSLATLYRKAGVYQTTQRHSM